MIPGDGTCVWSYIKTAWSSADPNWGRLLAAGAMSGTMRVYMLLCIKLSRGWHARWAHILILQAGPPGLLPTAPSQQKKAPVPEWLRQHMLQRGIVPGAPSTVSTGKHEHRINVLRQIHHAAQCLICQWYWACSRRLVDLSSSRNALQAYGLFVRMTAAVQQSGGSPPQL